MRGKTSTEEEEKDEWEREGEDEADDDDGDDDEAVGAPVGAGGALTMIKGESFQLRPKGSAEREKLGHRQLSDDSKTNLMLPAVAEDQQAAAAPAGVPGGTEETNLGVDLLRRASQMATDIVESFRMPPSTPPGKAPGTPKAAMH